MSGRRIAIVTHAYDHFETSRYLVAVLAAIWREQGHEVVVTRGPREHVDADLAIAHVDRTRTPRAYRRLLRRYPRVVNGRVVDISKRRISALVVRRGDRRAGRVIVKTDRNAGGVRELKHAREHGGLARAGAVLRHRLPWWARSALPGSYRTYSGPEDVPRGVWWNPDLVVERFVPEPCAGGYRVRLWRFFGDREIHSQLIGPDPLVKGRTAVRLEPLHAEVPPEVRAVRTELGFDFGKFDYGVVDGLPVIYDVNRTQSAPPAHLAQDLPADAQLLAGGIAAFL